MVLDHLDDVYTAYTWPRLVSGLNIGASNAQVSKGPAPGIENHTQNENGHKLAIFSTKRPAFGLQLVLKVAGFGPLATSLRLLGHSSFMPPLHLHRGTGQQRTAGKRRPNGPKLI